MDFINQFTPPPPAAEDPYLQAIRSHAADIQKQLAIEAASSATARMSQLGALPLNREEDERRRLAGGVGSAMMPHAAPPSTPAPRVNVATAPAGAAMAALGGTPDTDARMKGDTYGPPPPESHIRYSLDGGPMKDYGHGDTAPNVDAQFGPVQHPHGTVSMTGGSDDAGAYERYKRNTYGDSEYDAEQAHNALAQALTKDPFARERVASDIETKRQNSVQEFASRMRREEESGRRNAYSGEIEAIDSEAARRLARELDPVKRKKITDTADALKKTVQASFGFGEKIATKELYE